MYSIHKQLHPVTVVEYSLYCHFYNLSERNLVVGGGNQLRVYRLIGEQTALHSSNDKNNVENCKNECETNDFNERKCDETSFKVRLECIQSIQLHSPICGMQCVRLTGASRDSLLLSFAEAKLAVVEYDCTTHDLKTVSLHYFEEEDMKQGHTQFINPPMIRVDPESRCAAMLNYNRNIVILPFRKDIVSTDDTDCAQSLASLMPKTSDGSSHRSPVMASYKLNLSDDHYAGEKINNIIDIQFLHGYYEPTLLILHEPVRTWAGRVAVRQDTCAMVALSLNVHQKVHPIIWSTNHLPFDCFKTLPVPKPVGGVLIFAANSLTYLNQSVPPYSVSLNGFNEVSSSFPMTVQKNVKLSLDCANSCFLTNDKLVVSLKNGELYVITLFSDGMRSIRNIHFEKAASSVITSCITLCEPGYLFLGSRLGNSLLLKYIEKPVESLTSQPSDSKLNDIELDFDDTNPNIIESNESKEIGETNEVKEEKEAIESDEAEEPARKKIKEESDNDENEESKEQKDEQKEKPKENESNEPKAEENGGNFENWMAGDVALIKDVDELEVYGAEENTEEKLPSTLAFEVCDSILNIGPCGQICMGEPSFISDEFSDNKDPQVELVTTSGYGKNGALCVLQRTVRPQIVTTFELPNCTDMWTVFGPNTRSIPTDIRYHDFMILSRPDSTMILQTGVEMNELDHSGFSCQTTTILVGNIGDDQYIVQVCPSGVRLLSGIKQLQHVPLDLGSPIIYASLADPYLIVMSENGVVMQLCLKTDATSGIARLLLTKAQLTQSKSVVSALCAYKDISGLFTTEVSTANLNKFDISTKDKESETPTVSSNVTATKISTVTTVDDEDELLYGDATVEEISSLPLSDIKSSIKREVCSVESDDFKEPQAMIPVITEKSSTYWLFIVRDNGVLEVYTLPDYRLVYYVKNFPMGAKVLVDNQISDHIQQQEAILSLPTTREILVLGMGLKGMRPILFARFDYEVFIYEAFPFFETQVENHLKLRFRRVNYFIPIREPKVAKKISESNNETQHTDDYLANCKCWFRPFFDISSYSGVFVCGHFPYWVFMTSRGELRVHEMNIDGPVTSFASFHNVNCPKGFLYFNKNSHMRIGVLPTHVTYDAYWPVRKVPLRCTAHFVNYHFDSKCYCVVTSTLETYNKIVRVGGEEKDYEFLERDSRYIWPVTEKFSLQLLSPVSWEMIAGTKIELDEWEHVTCLKNVMLVSEGTESGLKGYIALGTNYCYGEDVTNRGRIWILDIIDVVPEPGQPLTRNKIKIVYCKEQKGPVTALCQVKGFLLSAIGQKIYIWQLKESQLVGVAFIDTQIYIHAAVSVKNLILIADVYKSISLLRYQEETRTLALVSKDIQSIQVYACEFMVDNNHLCFLISDSDQNIIIYAYQPEMKESFGGTRLIRKADFHLGLHVNSFFRIRCKVPSKYIEDKRVRQTIEKKQATMYASLDGTLGYILPISEKTYRRLLMLQNVMTTQVQHIAGLNPKAARLCKISKKLLLNPCKNILDGDLLFRYFTMSMNEKSEMAKKIGTTSEQEITGVTYQPECKTHYLLSNLMTNA
ncbi:cleavage and polyadenylation specificity factor subunit 1-like protein [Dinothrombium tinctorium]|uniref:Cleavage and polyadenylation specificity factor subunit 1-like protein n=1 Tax=Dinothrombium tinctorium TaxID=1965070 RepID=A0A3S3PHC1_9ACAR|nr:cleavage and polyadenylation specificity factor subunit 1-like protein [Dinothrombium tinctorium]RWS15286.1 cleavage and polyadenylation specificity factor subunit 1-like protein [Dinothrombium tinctorium]RWS15592.1 cleavage and polyadenylation specificity factor subunit 1-like protein [Dinothrombium tinctorium]